MSTQTLTINYRAPQPLIDPYWIRIEQDVVDDAATVTDPAKVLDALYQIEPCNQENSEPTPVAPVEQESAVDTIATVLDLPACDVEPDGSVQTTLRVYRSHLTEPYTLRLHGGTVVETVQESGPATTSMEIAETVTLDYPVVSGFTCTPAPLSRQGNTLRFRADQAGLQLSASYHSQWDRITVRITGVEGEPGDCRALAFHHGIVDAIDLEIPEVAELDRSLCPAHRWNFDPTDYEVTCYKIIEVTQRCTCSGDEVGSYTTEQVVPCPNQEMRCPNNQTTCMHLLGTEPLTEWVECAGDSEIPGRPGQNYLIASPAYYEEMCCHPPSATLPQCPVKRTVYKAELPIEHGQKFWRDLYGEGTRFVPVPPPSGICGEWIIEQRVEASGCCDGVPPLSWDTSISPEVISPNSSVIIGVTGGGRFALRWTISDAGFQFTDARDTEIVGHGSVVRLSALPTACGAVTVTVTDGCSTVRRAIRCTSGRWMRVGEIYSTLDYQDELAAIGAVKGNAYGGYRTTGDTWRFSQDGRYWIGPINAGGVQIGTEGTQFIYNLSLSTSGPYLLPCLLPDHTPCTPPGGCLDGLMVSDKIVGAFNIRLFVDCTPFNFGEASPVTGTYSWEIEPMSIWEWVC